MNKVDKTSQIELELELELDVTGLNIQEIESN